MKVSWLPGQRSIVAAVLATSLLLVWGTAFNGRSFGPVRLVLRALPYGDKVGHFALYGVITLGVSMLVTTRRQAVRAGVAIALVGVADELRQRGEVNRNFSFGDVVANCGGVAVALLVAVALSKLVGRSNVHR